MTAEDQPVTRPPRIHAHGNLVFSHTHVWTASGELYGVIDLGGIDITFGNPQQVRDLIGHLAALAGEMDAEVKRQRPAEVVRLPEPEGYPCTRCGATDTPKIDGRCSNHSRCNVRAAARAGAL